MEPEPQPLGEPMVALGFSTLTPCVQKVHVCACEMATRAQMRTARAAMGRMRVAGLCAVDVTLKRKIYMGQAKRQRSHRSLIPLWRNLGIGAHFAIRRVREVNRKSARSAQSDFVNLQEQRTETLEGTVVC